VSPYLQNGLISMVWANAPTSLLMIGDWCAGLLRCFVWQHYSDCQWGMYWSTSMYVGIWLLWDFEFELFGPKELSKYDRRWVQRFHMSDNQIITITDSHNFECARPYWLLLMHRSRCMFWIRR
jgi:hypothetical protein